QFSYSSSPDRQEPQRKIQPFATLAENVDNEAGRKKYLSKVRDEAQGMSALVRDVLTSSRLSAIPEFSKVNLNQGVDEVVADLSLLFAETCATVNSAELRAVMGLQRPLWQPLTNLISNSLKLVRGRPEVHITCRVVPKDAVAPLPTLQPGREYVQIMVQDNCIGFDQR